MDIAAKAAEIRALSDDELVDLLKQSLYAEALEQAGVDNWEGDEFARDSYREKLEAAGIED